MTDKQRVVILTSIESERLHYVLEAIFMQRLKINYLLTDKVQNKLPTDWIIEYNFTRTTDYDFIQASDLIVQKGVDNTCKPEISGADEDLVLFPDKNSLFGFDIFSAVFYCLSHYDAYTQKSFDEHKRIKYGQWFPRTSGLDKLPYVDIWVNNFKEYLESKKIACHSSQFEQDISFDIDHIYLFDQRPLLQHVKASIGDIIRFKFFQLFQRWLIILGLTEDPAERFFDILDYHFKSRFTFFMLMKHGRNNSLNPLNELKKLLIKKLKKHGDIGIHPSYDSATKPDIIGKEIKLLSEIVDYTITASRFHYLKVQFPSSFYHLESQGIQIDKTIGYYDQPGFLSGTTLPYHFYDPIQDKKMNLIIEPFVWMDSMNKYYRTLDDKEEKTELFYYKSLIKKYNGKFSVVFHNDSMIDRRYRKLFKSLLYN